MSGNLFRETGELIIQIPALRRPTLVELCKRHQENFRRIKYDTSPTEAITLRLATVLRSDEGYISTVECQHRIVSQPHIFLGYQQLWWLVEHQHDTPDLKNLHGQIYIDGPGLVLVDELGSERIPRINGGEKWFFTWTWITQTGASFFHFGRIAYSNSFKSIESIAAID